MEMRISCQSLESLSVPRLALLSVSQDEQNKQLCVCRCGCVSVS